MLIPSCGLCPGITEMLSGSVAPLRQHETHTGGGDIKQTAESLPADE